MTDNLLLRRINYNRFKEDDIPPRDTIESILRESILCAPFKGTFPFINLDVWGPEHHEIKNNFIKTTGRKIGVKWYENKELSEEEYTKKMESYYCDYPEDFNTQVLAPYLIAVVENPEYFEKSDRKAIYLRVGAIAYAITLSANRHGVDTSFCGCFYPQLNRELNKFCTDYVTEGRDILFLLGLGYFDFDGRDVRNGWKKISDDYIEHSLGGKYNIKTRQREGFKKKKPKYEKFVRWV